LYFVVATMFMVS